ncbi:MAG: ABC transporter permease [Alphaproteobacteria bacterium]|nr:ABC transporter permease [Alphaproteobacteria bacterium]MCB9931710.1 ABC transporter permease [Alphaproteobacteria bacterium]
MADVVAPGSALDPARALGPSPTARLFRRMRGHTSVWVGGGILLAILLMAVFAPLLAPHDPFEQDLFARLRPPFWMEGADPAHLLGTDNLGRDYLSRLIYGAQISLLIGICTALLSGIIGSALGVTAGYFGGRVDAVISFVITTRLSMPIVLVALAIVALVGGSLEAVILVLGLLLWDRYAVVMRSATQQARNMDYVAAARAIGCPTWRIVLSEILPNVVNNLIIIATFEVAHAILLEASLSFLGLGVQPPAPSWGLMIAEGKEFLLFDPWVITIPGIALSVLVLAVNMLGDGIRDVSAPENRS